MNSMGSEERVGGVGQKGRGTDVIIFYHEYKRNKEHDTIGKA